MINNYWVGLLGWLAGAVFNSAFANSVEILHWWTSPGEKAAVDVLEQQVNSSHLEWQDFAVAGGGGGNAISRNLLLLWP